MLKTILILVMLVNAVCHGQVLPIDTISSSKIILRIDSIENAKINCGSIIIWKTGHNETDFYNEFFLDTLRKQIFKCDYVQLTKEPGDTVLSRTSFYSDNNRFVAVVFRKYQNGKLIVFQKNYLNMENGEVKNIYPTPISKNLLIDDIKHQAKDLWLMIEQVEKHLREKYSG